MTGAGCGEKGDRGHTPSHQLDIAHELTQFPCPLPPLQNRLWGIAVVQMVSVTITPIKKEHEG